MVCAPLLRSLAEPLLLLLMRLMGRLIGLSLELRAISMTLVCEKRW